MAKLIKEKTIFALLGIILLFMIVNFDKDMALIFSLMIIIDYLIFKDDTFVSYPFERKTDNRILMFFEVALMWAMFMGLTAVIMRILTPSITSLTNAIQTIFELQASTKPALSGNKILTFIGWGVMIPIIETRFFFGRLLELIKDRWKKSLTILSLAVHIIGVVIGAIFALFHLTARQCGSAQTCQNAALLVTFLFGYVSTLMVIWKGETKQATLLHILTNSLSVGVSLGFFSILGITGG